MSLTRRIETRTEMFMGQELTYHVTIWVESLPEPSTYASVGGPDAPEGRSVITKPTLGTFVPNHGWEATPGPDATPEREPAKRRPTKEQYLWAFAAANVGRPWPACILRRRNEAHARIRTIRRCYVVFGVPMSGRVRDALRRVASLSLWSLYSSGDWARLRYEWDRHRARMRAFDQRHAMRM